MIGDVMLLPSLCLYHMRYRTIPCYFRSVPVSVASILGTGAATGVGSLSFRLLLKLPHLI